MIRRFGPWVGAVFAAWYLISAPQNAADAVRAAWRVLAHAADSLSQFISALS